MDRVDPLPESGVGIQDERDGVRIFVEMNGIAVMRKAIRQFVTSLTLRTGDERYAWTNELFGLTDGELSPVGLAVMTVYHCKLAPIGPPSNTI